MRVRRCDVAIRAVEKHMNYPFGAKEKQTAIRTLELHANFPAAVFGLENLGRNGVEGAVRGTKSQHRPANQAARAATPPSIFLRFLIYFSSISNLSSIFMGQSSSLCVGEGFFGSGTIF